MARLVARQSRASLEKLPGLSKRRAETLPYAALVLEGLIERLGLTSVNFSAWGVREGLLVLLLAPYGVKTDAGVAVGLLWFLATIVTGLVGGVLFMLEPRPAARPEAELPANT
jgi:hypothetical protein